MADISMNAASGEIPIGIDRLPTRVYLALVVSALERFAYNGMYILFQDYVMNPYKGPEPGVLGLGQSTATAVTSGFFAFQMIITLAGAFAADTKLGRYTTLLCSTVTYIIGAAILLGSSFPTSIQHGVAPAGFTVAAILLAFSAGVYQSTIYAFIGDQYTEHEPQLVTTFRGKQFIRDRGLTMQFIFNANYWGVNIASLAGVATTFMASSIGWWAAFLLPFCVLWIIPATLLLGRTTFVHDGAASNFKSLLQTTGSVLADSIHRRATSTSSADQKLKEQVKSTLKTCRVFIVFIFASVCIVQLNSNMIAQALEMETHGIPNSALYYADQASMIVFTPIIQGIIYPTLRRFGIPFPPITRMCTGILFLALAMAWAAITQSIIYRTGPCFDYPLTCTDPPQPNHVNVAVQLPTYILTGIGEIIALVTCTEYAYTRAPKGQQAIVQAVLLFMVGIGSLLALAISPAAHSPNMVILYSCISAVMGLAGVVFAYLFWNTDAHREQQEKEIRFGAGETDNGLYEKDDSNGKALSSTDVSRVA